MSHLEKGFRMNKINFFIRTGKSELTSVEGEIIAPGLAVHKTPGFNNGAWSISHIGSGMSLGITNVKTKKLAVSLGKAASKLTDWTQPVETCVSDITLNNWDRMLSIRRCAYYNTELED